MGFGFTADLNIKAGGDAKTIEAALKALRETQVLIGIPEDEERRDEGSGITNVALLYIHSNGSPLAGIPARPIIEPAVENAKENLGELMGEAAKRAADGDIKGMEEMHEKAGLAGEAAVREWFTNPSNAWAPLSPAYHQEKVRRGSTSPTILVETGELRRAITYVVRKDGG